MIDPQHAFIARRAQGRILDLVGTLEWDDSFDYKAERTRLLGLVDPLAQDGLQRLAPGHHVGMVGEGDDSPVR